MISHEEAIELIINSANQKNRIEKISIFDSLNRILAIDVSSDINMPPFDKSAMDGYACRFEDKNQPLTVLEVIPAGAIPTKKINKNECSKIMTGAIIPDGADYVIKVEDTRELSSNVIQSNVSSPARNICYIGEDIKINTLLLKAGTKLKPQHIAVLASAGKFEIEVIAKTTVGIISTGNELVEPNENLTRGKIRNSNAYQLYAQSANANAIPSYYGIALDEEKSLSQIISKAASENQIIILSGGVSMGDFDFVPKVLTDLNFEILFKSIAVQPGKPTVFAHNNNSFCFGLPGNPVSSFIQFELLVAPLIKLLQGEKVDNLMVNGKLSTPYQRKNSSRKAWIPVVYDTEKQVLQIQYNGSAHINAFVEANAIMEIPIGTLAINKGEQVNVRLLS
ncbi:MAG: gephyrin-like molybdotransferase Glp [Bacteroidota bacterium]